MFTIRPQVQNYSSYSYRKCVHRIIVSPGSDFVLQRVSLVPDRGQFIIQYIMEKRHLQVPQSTISEDELQSKSGIIVFRLKEENYIACVRSLTIEKTLEWNNRVYEL